MKSRKKILLAVKFRIEMCLGCGRLGPTTPIAAPLSHNEERDPVMIWRNRHITAICTVIAFDCRKRNEFGSHDLYSGDNFILLSVLKHDFASYNSLSTNTIFSGTGIRHV